MSTVIDFDKEENICKVEIDLRTLLSSIEEVGQCPICLELVKPPVTLCINGHGICTACKASLTKCPTCTRSFCDTVPRILNEILHKIPRVCKFYDHGCRLPASNDHELYCKFRIVNCVFHNEENDEYCDWKGPADEFGHHVYQSSHFEPCYVDIYTRETFRIRNFKDSAATKDLLDDYWPVVLEDETSSGEIFLFYRTKLHGNFCLYIKHFPLKKPTGIIYFTISFGNSLDDVIYKYKIRATTMIELEREVKVEENIYCMRVPLEELEKLVDEDASLSATFVMTVEPF